MFMYGRMSSYHATVMFVKVFFSVVLLSNIVLLSNTLDKFAIERNYVMHLLRRKTVLEK